MDDTLRPNRRKGNGRPLNPRGEPLRKPAETLEPYRSAYPRRLRSHRTDHTSTRYRPKERYRRM